MGATAAIDGLEINHLIMTSQIRNRRRTIDNKNRKQKTECKKNIEIKTSTKSFYLETIKFIISINGNFESALLIILFDLLKHCVELFLLFGRNKLWTCPQRIANQPELG